jgi:hypothetical protein
MMMTTNGAATAKLRKPTCTASASKLLLRGIERNRQALLDAAKALQCYVDNSPGFAKTWREFIAAGGVSSGDFERFLDDRMRHRTTKRKRHLRLVASNKPTAAAQSWW